MGKKLLILLLVVFSFSCEEPIDIDYPEAQVNLVLNGLLVSGDTLEASLSLSVPYNKIEDPPYLNSGVVKVFEDNQLIGEMSVCSAYERSFGSLDSVYTFCLPEECKADASYTFEASYEGFEPISASTKIAKTPSYSNVNYFPGSNQLIMTLRESVNENTYYILEVFDFDTISGQTFTNTGFISTRDLTLELIGNATAVFDVPSGESFGTQAYIDPTSFDSNGEKRINITAIVLNQTGIYLRIVSCSEEYFRFSRTRAINTATTGNDPFAEPYQIYSNVSNGYGILGSLKDTIIRLE